MILSLSYYPLVSKMEKKQAANSVKENGKKSKRYKVLTEADKSGEIPLLLWKIVDAQEFAPIKAISKSEEEDSFGSADLGSGDDTIIRPSGGSRGHIGGYDDPLNDVLEQSKRQYEQEMKNRLEEDNAIRLAIAISETEINQEIATPPKDRKHRKELLETSKKPKSDDKKAEEKKQDEKKPTDEKKEVGQRMIKKQMIRKKTRRNQLMKKKRRTHKNRTQKDSDKSEKKRRRNKDAEDADAQNPIREQKLESNDKTPTNPSAVDHPNIREFAWQELQLAIRNLETGQFQHSIPHLQAAISTLISSPDGYNAFREEIKFAAMYYQVIHLIIEGLRYRDGLMYRQYGLVLARTANIPILPEHRLILTRQALKANFLLGNFHTSAGFLTLLLQVQNDGMPQETLQKMLDKCQQEGFVESHNAAGDLSRPPPLCFQVNWKIDKKSNRPILSFVWCNFLS